MSDLLLCMVRRSGGLFIGKSQKQGSFYRDSSGPDQ